MKSQAYRSRGKALSESDLNKYFYFDPKWDLTRIGNQLPIPAASDQMHITLENARLG